MLNEKELDLLKYMDYQVMNNGIEGWIGNRGFDRLESFIELLYKRGSELDKQVAAIFIRATSAALGALQNKEVSLFMPEIQELYEKYNKQLEACNEEYKKLSKPFMASYGMDDYITTFMKQIQNN